MIYTSCMQDLKFIDIIIQVYGQSAIHFLLFMVDIISGLDICVVFSLLSTGNNVQIKTIILHSTNVTLKLMGFN